MRAERNGRCLQSVRFSHRLILNDCIVVGEPKAHTERMMQVRYTLGTCNSKWCGPYVLMQPALHWHRMAQYTQCVSASAMPVCPVPINRFICLTFALNFNKISTRLVATHFTAHIEIPPPLIRWLCGVRLFSWSKAIRLFRLAFCFLGANKFRGGENRAPKNGVLCVHEVCVLILKFTYSLRICGLGIHETQTANAFSDAYCFRRFLCFFCYGK